jgi:protein TonB
MYYLNVDRGKHRRMKIALAMAAAAHVAMALSITFKPAGTPRYSPQIDVTLATQPTRSAPEDARHIAQSNQLGGADPADFTEISARNVATTARPPSRAGRQREEAPGESRDSRLTTRGRSHTADSERLARAQQQEQLLGISPEVDQLSQELADLQAQLDQQSRAYSDLPRVRRLTSVAARQSADAAYLQDWRQRVEAVGNKYYPEASVRYGIYGSLRLLVVIRYDGGLEDIRILSSSGFAVLDEAALKIVRMAAPFAPFPTDLRAVADRVEIIRTWQFQENRLSSG